MSTKPAVTSTCIFRRVLSSLLNTDLVSAAVLMERMGLTEEAAQAVLSKLERDGVVASSESSSQEMSVNMEILTKKSFPAYLGIKKFQDSSPAAAKNNDEFNPVGDVVESIRGLNVEESVPRSAGAGGDVSIQKGGRKGKGKRKLVDEEVSSTVVIDRVLDEGESSVGTRSSKRRKGSEVKRGDRI